jgi:hypothetical protein
MILVAIFSVNGELVYSFSEYNDSSARESLDMMGFVSLPDKEDEYINAYGDKAYLYKANANKA